MTLPLPQTPSGKRLYKAIGRRAAILAIEAEAALPAAPALVEALREAASRYRGAVGHWQHLHNKGSFLDDEVRKTADTLDWAIAALTANAGAPALDVERASARLDCRVYWGSHGCSRPRGHVGPHICDSCYDPDDTDGYVGAPPYYGPKTKLWGEDAAYERDPASYEPGDFFFQHRDGILAIEAESRDIAIAVTDSGEIAGWMQREEDAYQQARAEAALPAAPALVEALDFDALRVVREWPTPNHMRRIADALDAITPAKYGDVLRWFADRCDERVWHMGDPAAAERLTQARAALAAYERGEGT